MIAADRDRELILLRGVLADERLEGFDRSAFQDMLDWLEEAPHGHLSRKQRDWLESVANRLEVDAGPIDHSKVPRGQEVPPAWDAAGLPKRPPGQRG